MLAGTSPPDTSSPSRTGRFRRLTYLRSRSHGGDPTAIPRSREPARPPVPRPSISRTTSANDTNFSSPLRGRAPGTESRPDSFETTQPSLLATLFSSPSSVEAGHEGAVPTPFENVTKRRRSATTSVLPMPSTTARPSTAQTHATHVNGGTSLGTSTPIISTNQAASKATTSPQLPRIRIVPFQDVRSARPSLSFPTISRTLPDNNAILRIGRYSEKDLAPELITAETPSDAPIGFKSKVVSRRHCEFSWSDSSWWIRDVQSSSGTFLNHIRLSSPGKESKPYKVKDGDIVQLGIDFKGGEESIFRCVRMRITYNRGWQQGLNNFNTSAHKQLQQLKNQITSTGAKDSTTDCTICLMAIGPCQSLFIAPCSHTWHYKCIRPLISEHAEYSYPHFLCPNCRAVADLEEEIEEPEPWSAEEQAEDVHENTQPQNESEAPDTSDPAGVSDDTAEQEHDLTSVHRTSSEDEQDHEQEPEPDQQIPNSSQNTTLFAPSSFDYSNATSQETPSASARTNENIDPNSNSTYTGSSLHHIHMAIPATRTSDFFPPGWRSARYSQESNEARDYTVKSTTRESSAAENNAAPSTPRPTMVGSAAKFPTFRIGSPEGEGLLTPRNDAGPFVFDGGATV